MKRKKLTEMFPQISGEWNYKKNSNLDIDDMTIGSKRKVWWQCGKGHEWSARIDQRCCNLTGCPYCSGSKVLKFYNDLTTLNPELSKEWNYKKNIDIMPYELSVSSRRKVWWQCTEGHEWIAEVGNRNKGTGCPYCAGQKVMIGYNDLATINPIIAAEWHPSKNKELTPYGVTSGSGKKVWWHCKDGHEWEAVVGDRNKGHGCPYCTGKRIIEGKTDLAAFNPKLKNEWNSVKNDKLSPQDISYGSKKKVWWQCKRGHEWKATVSSRNHGIGCPYCAGKRAIVGETDLATVNPKVAHEWHSIRNRDLIQQDVTAGSGKRVWWKCNNGHEWEAIISNRCKRTGTGCPYCSGRRVIKGETDLATINSELVKEWHPVKNGDLKPEDVTTGSSKKVWWQCSKGHEWKTAVAERKKYGCPYCNGKYVIKGENDLLTINPKLAAEWHYLKNAPLTAQDISGNCNRKVWWQCSEGHEWNAVVSSRNGGTGCPYCFGRKVIKGETDLATKSPELAKDWHPYKNGELTSQDVTASTHKKVWWKCKNGHEWKSTISNRIQGNNCPYCAGQKVIVGVTDLMTMNPDLAKEWNNVRNGKLSPSDVTVGSTRKVWWLCNKGHEWRAIVGNRSKGTGCPYCAHHNSN